MSKTGRPWVVTTPPPVAGVVAREDHVEVKVDIPPLLPPAEMGQLIAEELAERKFEDRDGILVRERGGVTTQVDPETGDVRVSADGEVNLPDPPAGGCGCRAAAKLADAERAGDDLQKDVTRRLEKAIRTLGCELEGAIARATKKAVKIKAAQLGQIKSISEDKEGGVTVVVEVA